MTRSKPRVGDTVFVHVLNKYSQYDRTATVTKVGRKWFELDKVAGSRFAIDDWHEDTIYSASVELWESEQAYVDHIEATKISRELSRYFPEYGKSRLGLSLLRTIKKLIEVEE